MPIKSYSDLIVYQNLYKAMALVLTIIVPNLPKEEKNDLASQLRRACKSPQLCLPKGMLRKTTNEVGKNI